MNQLLKKMLWVSVTIATLGTVHADNVTLENSTTTPVELSSTTDGSMNSAEIQETTIHTESDATSGSENTDTTYTPGQSSNKTESDDTDSDDDSNFDGVDEADDTEMNLDTMVSDYVNPAETLDVEELMHIIQMLMGENNSLSLELESVQTRLSEAHTLLHKLRVEAQKSRANSGRNIVLTSSAAGVLGALFGAALMHWYNKP